MPVAMTVAGSDSGGGAGVQADLKTFAALGVYGASALTAITAQNTVAVTAVHELPIDLIAAQIEAVVSDIGVDAVKTGMLSSSEIVEVVARELDRHGIKNLVVDPVMIAKSGDPLLRQEAVDSVRTLLVPLACIVTPNVPEAETLTGMKVETDEDMREAARRIIGMGARAVVVKGGHREGPATDLFYDGTEFVEFTSDRFDTVNTHGTGCTFASATAAGLAQGKSVVEAVAQAKEYVTEAIRNSYPLGQGHGPVHHFWQLWDKS
ncbi:Hydroxymethylpyrimidine/phosphomethylpyrimidine kinase [Geodia barretti]|uniref:Hydroxymethylpyrimidine/phosphomethylpyrimidine kinase n=2 Tax=Geodia barretti TaxID=519541 RepID=A0AA35RLW0_GEOBA|nr:Hydroxymethylpyrimidine/phosphomethylpyrimidine kinase [Geodia barretti]